MQARVPRDEHQRIYERAIVNKTACRTGGEVGLEVMRIVDAAYRSSRGNRVVMLQGALMPLSVPSDGNNFFDKPQDWK